MQGSLEFEGEVYPQTNGQLMGNLLSFPLLCIVNYLGVVMALGGKRTLELSKNGRLKVNGDDIAFRSTRAEYDKWASTVARAGLTLSRGKTLVHPRFFSLNSTFFRAEFSRQPTLVPVLRGNTIFKRCDDFTSFVGRLRAALWGWTGPARQELAAVMMRKHNVHLFPGTGTTKRETRSPWTSLVHGGGVRGLKAEAFGKAGLAFARREWDILSGGREKDVMPIVRHGKAFPTDQPEYDKSALPIPEGWVQVPSFLVDYPIAELLAKDFVEACVSKTWNTLFGKRKSRSEGLLRYRKPPTLRRQVFRRYLSGLLGGRPVDLDCPGSGRTSYGKMMDALGGEIRSVRRKDPVKKVWIPDVLVSRVRRDPVFKSGGVQASIFVQ